MDCVLVIDDEEMVRNILQIVIERTGRFSVLTGETGNELCAMLAARNDVAAVICDYTLRGETGIGIHTRIERVLRSRGIAFILIHGYGRELRRSLPDGYLEDHRIAEVLKPMRSVLDIEGILDAEIAKARV